MALTKIKLNTMVTGTLPDANIPDDITIDTASSVPASGLTGNTLASGVTASSLTSVGTLSSLTVSGVASLGNNSKVTSSSADTTFKIETTSGTTIFPVLDFVSSHSSIGAKIRQDGGDVITIDNDQDVTFADDVTVSGVGYFGTTASYIKQSRFGYSSSYKVLQLGLATSTSAISIGADVSGNSSGGFTGNEILIPNARGILAPNNANNAFLGVLAVTSSDTIEIGRGNHSIINTSGNAISINTSNNYTKFDSNVGINCSPSFLLNVDYGAPASADRYIGVFQAESTRQLAIGWDDNVSSMAIGTRTNHDLVFFTNGISNPRMTLGNTGMLNIGNNDTGSAGSTNKQLSLGASSSTQFATNNVGTFTGLIVSNSYTNSSNQLGTATGIAFTHHASSSGISYIASKAGSNSGDRSSLHFGTRGSGGVAERLMLNDNGEVYIGHGGDGYLRHYQINSNAHNWVLYPYSDDSYRFNRNGSGSDEMRLESDGDLVILGNLTQSSDIRLKENIETIPNALSKVNQLRGVTYNWNETSGRDTEAKQIGMIADEVEEILPELVKVDSVKGSFDEDGLDNIKSLKYGNVVGLLVEAVKELSAKVEELENA